MTSQFADMTLLSNFFDVAVCFLSDLITGLSFMLGVRTIFIFEGLTRNLEIGNTPV